MKERRRYYRIDDKAVLNYRIIQSDRLEEGITALKLNIEGHSGLQNSLAVMDTRVEQLLETLADPSPEIAEVLQIFNNKINFVAKLVRTRIAGLEPDREMLSISASNINLSGSGIAMESVNALARGAYLELEMVIFPEHRYIKAFGKVVDCRKDDAWESELPYQVAINFEFIREDDREYIIQHTLKKQYEQLQNLRADKQAR